MKLLEYVKARRQRKGRRLRCYLQAHRWVKKYVPGQAPYFECQDCGKDSETGGVMRIRR